MMNLNCRVFREQVIIGSGTCRSVKLGMQTQLKSVVCLVSIKNVGYFSEISKMVLRYMQFRLI